MLSNSLELEAKNHFQSCLQKKEHIHNRSYSSWYSRGRFRSLARKFRTFSQRNGDRLKALTNKCRVCWFFNTQKGKKEGQNNFVKVSRGLNPQSRKCRFANGKRHKIKLNQKSKWLIVVSNQSVRKLADLDQKLISFSFTFYGSAGREY